MGVASGGVGVKVKGRERRERWNRGRRGAVGVRPGFHEAKFAREVGC